ncbi:hypothetical protein U9M48_007889 [Paspalum notatum var. saurae]|uniref:Uncharacterized protein n=1 Tax=Paspalum notatum var. saurae TaxID=547442 RepID=A0AAQ3SN03_PASNO
MQKPPEPHISREVDVCEENREIMEDQSLDDQMNDTPDEATHSSDGADLLKMQKPPEPHTSREVDVCEENREIMEDQSLDDQMNDTPDEPLSISSSTLDAHQPAGQGMGSRKKFGFLPKVKTKLEPTSLLSLGRRLAHRDGVGDTIHEAAPAKLQGEPQLIAKSDFTYTYIEPGPVDV